MLRAPHDYSNSTRPLTVVAYGSTLLLILVWLPLLSSGARSIFAEVALFGLAAAVSLSARRGQDKLTDLPNRAVFMRRLSRAVTRTKRDNTHRFAVLLLDLFSQPLDPAQATKLLESNPQWHSPWHLPDGRRKSKSDGKPDLAAPIAIAAV